MQELLDECQNAEEFEVWFATNEDIREHGTGAEIWEY